MKDLKTYIESGVLEAFVLGSLTDAEIAEVLGMSAKHPEIEEEIAMISAALEQVAFENAVAPDPTIKPFFLATVDYIARLEGGEAVAFPPELHAGSTPADYAEWLDRPDMVLPGELENFFAKIIGHTPEQTTVIAWIRHMSPPEVHTKEYEKFLILEGTCDIFIGDEVHHLEAGDYLAIPLYVEHSVKITSEIPCKVILQRIAA